MILITGGAGFVGANFISHWIATKKAEVVNFDKLTSTANLNNLSQLEHNTSYHFVKGDIRNRPTLKEALQKYKPTAIIHFAAETPNDRSLQHPEYFIQKNVLGTFDLLEETLSYWKLLDNQTKEKFRFVNVSTSEVYGMSSQEDRPVTEEAPFMPTRPYSASKASADHLVRAYNKTYGLPTLTTHCSNNFGPFQFPKKLIPLIIVNAIQGNPLEIYNEGQSKTPWLYVGDQCEALRLLLEKGIPGESYNIGAQALTTNEKLIELICKALDDLNEDSLYKPHSKLITIVKSASKKQHQILDDTKIKRLGWSPSETFETNLRKTIQWYLHNMSWVENVVSGGYKDWIHSGNGASV